MQFLEPMHSRRGIMGHGVERCGILDNNEESEYDVKELGST